MSTASLTKTRKRSPERNTFLADVLTAAIESRYGCETWAEVRDYTWWDEMLDEGDMPEAPGGGCNAYARLVEHEDHTEYRVTLDVIARGARRIADGSVPVRDDIRQRVTESNRMNDFNDMDAIDADCVVQAGLLAKIVYG